MEKEKSNKKTKVILVIVIILLLAVIGVLAWMVLHPKREEAVPAQTEATSANPLELDQAAVALDEESLQKAYDEMMAKEGTMALSMGVTASSSDGENFTCNLGNSTRNKYNMFMIIYLDETGEELYHSGLIPVGMKIDNFKTNRKLEPGSYTCTVVYNQIEEDNETIHSQVSIGLTLNVI